MRALKLYRDSFYGFYGVSRRSLYGVFAVTLLTISLTACIGPVKLVPTQQSQEATPSATETTETPKTVVPTPPDTPPAQSAIPPMPLPSIDVARPAAPQGEEEIPVVEANPVVVTAQRESYRADRAVTATKTDTPLQETPVSVQVVPRQVIEDQKTPTIREVLENVSGVRSRTSLGRSTGFVIRGFPDNNRIYRNGLLSTPPFFQAEFDTANIESIEVLKGPAAVLYGRIEPGGMVNINTKRPLETTSGALEQQFGSYDFYRTLWDITGAVTADKSLSVRFAGGYQNSRSFRDFNFTDRKTFNPSVTWRPTDATTLTVDVEILKHDSLTDSGIPVLGNRPAPVPISRSFSDPNTPTGFRNKTHIGFQLDHRFNESWKLTNRLLTSFLDAEDIWANPTPAFGDALQANGRTLNRNIFGQTSNSRVYATNLDLVGTFKIAETQHKVLVGFDFFKSKENYGIFGDFDNPNPALAIDLFNPTYGIDPSLFKAARTIGTDFFVFHDQWYGVYFQDQVTLWNKLRILAGGRYDWAENGVGRGGRTLKKPPGPWIPS